MEKIDEYEIKADNLVIPVAILGGKGITKKYHVYLPSVAPATKALMDYVKHGLITEVAVSTKEILDPKAILILKEKFTKRARLLVQDKLPNISQDTAILLINILMQEMLGLGDIEYLLADENLEEIVITSSKEPLRIYHKSHGWLETNITLESEEKILNYANIIGRRVGRQITTLNPLLDAHLITGDRANAVLFPICTKGHTITIRRFARDPWTMTDFIKNKTATSKILALIWLSIQYEMNILISGGTASGKTSMLNICMPYIPSNHRIVSIEDTRELQLPKYLYWCPLTVRQPNPEGKGEVCMYPGSYFVNGQGELHEISSYVEKKLKRGSKQIKENVIVADGDGDTLLAGDPKTFTYTKEKIKTYSKITDRKYICNITCADGTVFSLTENTKLPILNKKGTISLLNPFEIKKLGTCRIPLLTKINIPTKTQTIKLFDVFDKKDIYACNIKKPYALLEKDLRKHYTLKQLAKTCNITRQSFTYYRQTGIVNMHTLKKLATLSQKHSLSYFEKKIHYLKGKGGNSNWIKIPRSVTKDLAYFAGFVLAEKFINKNRLVIAQKEDITYILKPLLKRLFGISLQHRKEDYNKYIVSSTVLSHFLITLFHATKAADITTPKIIMRSPDQIIAAFLGGYLDGDGSVRQGHLSLSSMHERIIREFKYLFTRLGIRSSLYRGEQSGFSTKPCFTLNIATRIDAQKACSLLLFKQRTNITVA